MQTYHQPRLQTRTSRSSTHLAKPRPVATPDAHQRVRCPSGQTVTRPVPTCCASRQAPRSGRPFICCEGHGGGTCHHTLHVCAGCFAAPCLDRLRSLSPQFPGPALNACLLPVWTRPWNRYGTLVRSDLKHWLGVCRRTNCRPYRQASNRHLDHGSASSSRGLYRGSCQGLHRLPHHRFQNGAHRASREFCTRPRSRLRNLQLCVSPSAWCPTWRGPGIALEPAS